VVTPLVCSYKGFEIDDRLERTNFQTVHAWLSGTYWSPGISIEVVERGARNSALVVGAFLPETGEQAGFLRVVSDTTRFAWICDVFVDPAHRGKGLASTMVRFAVNHPDLADVTRWLLATRDAHDVYKSVGFEPLAEPDRWMQYRPNQSDGQAC
jgi:GNAT superfamily N-acetyltransferase